MPYLNWDHWTIAYYYNGIGPRQIRTSEENKNLFFTLTSFAKRSLKKCLGNRTLQRTINRYSKAKRENYQCAHVLTELSTPGTHTIRSIQALTWHRGAVNPFTYWHIDLALKKWCVEGSLNLTRAVRCAVQWAVNRQSVWLWPVQSFHFHLFWHFFFHFHLLITPLQWYSYFKLFFCSFIHMLFAVIKNSTRLFYWHCKILDMYLENSLAVFFLVLYRWWELKEPSKDWETL